MADPYPFRDKVIVVTGGSRGLGLAVARYLLIRGAKVAIAATSESNLAKALQGILTDIPEVKDRISTTALDISKGDQVEAWINSTVAKWGKLDGAANMAGELLATS